MSHASRCPIDASEPAPVADASTVNVTREVDCNGAPDDSALRGRPEAHPRPPKAAEAAAEATDHFSTYKDGEMRAMLATAKRLERITKRAGLLNKSRVVHNLRHYFATALFRVGVNSCVAQDLLGRADLTTTMRYAHVEAHDLKSGIARLETFVA